jgi:hypothetical protein
MSKDSEWFLFRKLPIGTCFHVSDDGDQPLYKKISNEPVNNCTVDDHPNPQTLSLDFECRWVLTDAEIGQVIRWLCTIPQEASLRIRIFCDDCEMAFGTAHPIDAGWCLNPRGDTLMENIQNIIMERDEINAWVREHVLLAKIKEVTGCAHDQKAQILTMLKDQYGDDVYSLWPVDLEREAKFAYHCLMNEEHWGD